MSEKFLCPKCKTKVPFKETFNFKKDHITKCSNCGAELVPINNKSWNWGFFMGFISVTVPAKLYLNYCDNNFLIAAMIGLLTFFLVLLFFLIWQYNNIEFREKD